MELFLTMLIVLNKICLDFKITVNKTDVPLARQVF
jgi:hypothetical protein